MFSRLRILTCVLLLLALGHRAVANDVHTEFDVKPLPLRTPPPRYPAELKAQGVAGIVLLTVVIDREGQVESCEVVRASDEGFIEPTTVAVKQWRFRPAEKGGEKVRARFQLPVQFSNDG